jgi:hypothetical protein
MHSVSFGVRLGLPLEVSKFLKYRYWHTALSSADSLRVHMQYARTVQCCIGPSCRRAGGLKSASRWPGATHAISLLLLDDCPRTALLKVLGCALVAAPGDTLTFSRRAILGGTVPCNWLSETSLRQVADAVAGNGSKHFASAGHMNRNPTRSQVAEVSQGGQLLRKRALQLLLPEASAHAASARRLQPVIYGIKRIAAQDGSHAGDVAAITALYSKPGAAALAGAAAPARERLAARVEHLLGLQQHGLLCAR